MSKLQRLLDHSYGIKNMLQPRKHVRSWTTVEIATNGLMPRESRYILPFHRPRGRTRRCRGAIRFALCPWPLYRAPLVRGLEFGHSDRVITRSGAALAPKARNMKAQGNALGPKHKDYEPCKGGI